MFMSVHFICDVIRVIRIIYQTYIYICMYVCFFLNFFIQKVKVYFNAKFSNYDHV